MAECRKGCETVYMVFEEIIRYSPRRRALHSIAEGFSPTARARTGLSAQSPFTPSRMFPHIQMSNIGIAPRSELKPREWIATENVCGEPHIIQRLSAHKRQFRAAER